MFTFEENPWITWRICIIRIIPKFSSWNNCKDYFYQVMTLILCYIIIQKLGMCESRN